MCLPGCSSPVGSRLSTGLAQGDTICIGGVEMVSNKILIFRIHKCQYHFFFKLVSVGKTVLIII